MITTMTVDAGVFGEVEITISYRFCAPHNGRGVEPDEPASATIGWIKFGGIEGVEVNLADDYIADEVIPHCVAHYCDDSDAACDELRDRMRDDALIERFIEERKAA